jgi:acetyl esterase/lipase
LQPTRADSGETSLLLDLYTPSGAPSGLPTLLYLHGGGWAVGDKSDAAVERLMPIVTSGFAVASVNHRLVPSVRFPAPVHDVKAAVRWLGANAAEYGLDPDRIAIGGVSAGGHLASLTVLTAGDPLLEGDLGDHLGVSSAVSAVVAYCLSSDFLLSGGRNARSRPRSSRVCGLLRCSGSTASTTTNKSASAHRVIVPRRRACRDLMPCRYARLLALNHPLTRAYTVKRVARIRDGWSRHHCVHRSGSKRSGSVQKAPLSVGVERREHDRGPGRHVEATDLVVLDGIPRVGGAAGYSRRTSFTT